MATISTSTYLDDGTARTSNEAFTINSGATLTVRTDTRWHANAPASMTGAINNVSCSSTNGGGYFIDATAVRWLAYNSGTGNVPAIGTTITQGAVSGYLLGVWADYTSAPTAVGAAMPATGYIKFREVTGGNYSAGALTGIGATATSADVLGWIEVVHNTSTNVTVYGPGLGFKTRGGWFELGTTSGSANQLVQIPTNGGGAATECQGLSIETAPGSGVYEWWPAISASAAAGYGFLTTSLGTDDRAKVVCYTSNGQMRIGGDGTNITGKVPVAGCKIRVPNIFLRQAATGTPATNAAQSATASSNTRIGSSAGGKIDMENIYSNWCHNHTTANYFKLKDSAIQLFLSFTTMLAPFTVDNVAFAHITSTATSNTWATCNYGGTISGLTMGLQSSSVGFSVNTTCANLTFNNLKIIKASTRAAAQGNIAINSFSTVINTFITIGGYVSIAGGSITINNLDYCDRSILVTTSSASQNAVQYSAGGPHTLNGLTFGLGDTIAGQQCYGDIISSSSTTNLTLRNFGSYTTPLNTGSSATVRPLRLLSFAGTDTNLKMQRCYVTALRSGGNIVNTTAVTTSNIYIDNSGDASYASSFPDIVGQDTYLRGALAATGTNSSAPNALGSIFSDYFKSTTAGILVFLANAPSVSTEQYITLSGTAQYIGNGSVLLPANGDYAIIESPYTIIGHTAFANIAPTNAGSGNYTTEYQLYNGSSWNGTWKTLSAANLSAETISATGFKIKIKVTATDTNASRYFTRVRIETVSTTAAQRDNLYPLSTATLGFTGLQTGSEVRVYAGTDPATSVEIGGIESTSGSTFSFSHSYGGNDGYIMIFALGYQPIYIPYTFKSVDDSILIQQVIDRNYTNPA